MELPLAPRMISFWTRGQKLDKALELGPVGYLPTDIGQLREELARRDLSICGGTACYDFLKARSFADVRGDVDDLCKRLQAFDVHYLMTMDGTAMDCKTKASRSSKSGPISFSGKWAVTAGTPTVLRF